MGRLERIGPGVLVIAAAIVVLLVGPEIVRRIENAQTQARVQQARLALHEDDLIVRLNGSFRNVALAVEPSVVHITVRRPLATSDLLTQRVEQSSGSGWVYDDKGHIVTNYHVVRNAEQIEARFSDGSPWEARLVGYDELSDIAVIRVSRSTLIPARRAPADSLRQGDFVFAFGSPFHFEFSMSSGIVSGLGRQAGILGRSQSYENFIQTDASINPGNSGGPLTDIRGEVVGMNTAIAVDGNDRSGSGRFSGVGLAIPVEMIEFVVNQIIETGRVDSGGLGLGTYDLTAEIISQTGFRGDGVFVSSVDSASPADRAGLQRGDIITQVNGAPVPNSQALRTLVHNQLPGTPVMVQVWRDGRELTVIVELGTWDRSQGRLQIDVAPPVESHEFTGLGVVISGISETLRTRLRLEEPGGVYVQRLLADSPGYEMGLRAGMVILEVNGRPVTDVSDLLDAIADDSDSGIDLTVLGPGADRGTVHIILNDEER